MQETSGGPVADPTLWALAHLLDLERVTAPSGHSDPVAAVALAQLLCGGLRFGVAATSTAPLRGRRTLADELHLLQRVLHELGLEVTLGAVTPHVDLRLGRGEARMVVWVDRASLPWHGCSKGERGRAARLLTLVGRADTGATRIVVRDADARHILDELDLSAAGAAVPNGQGMALALVPPPIEAVIAAAERALVRAVRGWALPHAFGVLAAEAVDDGPDAALALARDLLLSDGEGGGASGPLAGLDGATLRDTQARMWAYARFAEGDGCLGRRVFAEGVRVISAVRQDAELRSLASTLLASASAWREAIESLLPTGSGATLLRRREQAYADALRLGTDPDAAHLLRDAADAARRSLVRQPWDEAQAADAREAAGRLWLGALGNEREIVAMVGEALRGWGG